MVVFVVFLLGLIKLKCKFPKWVTLIKERSCLTLMTMKSLSIIFRAYVYTDLNNFLTVQTKVTPSKYTGKHCHGQSQ